MPVKIADDLPARAVLEQENIFIMPQSRAITQDIRPLKLLILNLMPLKIPTEIGLLRALSNTPLQIEVELLQTATHTPKNTPQDYLDTFYKTFAEIKENHYDGMIITGAPVENLPFEEVGYWQELCEIMEWTKSHVFSTLHICWGAQAGLYYHYGIDKKPLPEKKFGIFAHNTLVENEPLFRGFDDIFHVPHSRHTEVPAEDIAAHSELQLLAASKEAGAHIVLAKNGRQIFMFGHPEYERCTLKAEYDRDIAKGLAIALPCNYYPNDDPKAEPAMNWGSHAQLFYSNWLNYYVYQTTPYDLTDIGN